MQTRTRYHVIITGNSQEEHAVVIANSPEEMKSLVRKLYKHLIIDDRGLPSGEILYEVKGII